MISMKRLLDMVCTEAIEHGGVQEVPDHLYGDKLNYFDPKRDARRGQHGNGEGKTGEHLPPIRYDLELIRGSDGNLRWQE